MGVRRMDLCMLYTVQCDECRYLYTLDFMRILWPPSHLS